MDSTGVGAAVILVDNVYCVPFLSQELGGKVTNLTVKSVFADTVCVNSALIAASAMTDTDSDDTHMFRLRAVGQAVVDLLFIK
jgi:hypothetical protein